MNLWLTLNPCAGSWTSQDAASSQASGLTRLPSSQPMHGAPADSSQQPSHSQATQASAAMEPRSAGVPDTTSQGQDADQPTGRASRLSWLWRPFRSPSRDLPPGTSAGKAAPAPSSRAARSTQRRPVGPLLQAGCVHAGAETTGVDAGALLPGHAGPQQITDQPLPPSAAATQQRSWTPFPALSLGRARLAPAPAAVAAAAATGRADGSMQDAELSSGALSRPAPAPKQDDSSRQSASGGDSEQPGRKSPASQQEQVLSAVPSVAEPAQRETDDRPPGLVLHDGQSEPAPPAPMPAEDQRDKQRSYLMLTEAWRTHKPAAEARSRIPHLQLREAQAATTAAAGIACLTHADKHSLASTDPEEDQEVLASVLTRLRKESQNQAALSAQTVEAERQAAELNPTRTKGAHATIASHSLEGESSPCLSRAGAPSCKRFGDSACMAGQA